MPSFQKMEGNLTVRETGMRELLLSGAFSAYSDIFHYYGYFLFISPC